MSERSGIREKLASVGYWPTEYALQEADKARADNADCIIELLPRLASGGVLALAIIAACLAPPGPVTEGDQAEA